MSYSRWLAGILVIAVAARVAILLYAEQRPGRFDYPDSHRYIAVARNIAAGYGPIESATVRAGTDPLYPIILAAGVRLGFDGADGDAGLMRFGRIVNAVLGVFGVALLGALARKLAGDPAALIAAGLLALDPIVLFFNALVLTETCYILLLLAGFCCVALTRERGGWSWGVSGGLLLGLATVARSSGLFLPLMVAPVVWYFAKRGAGRQHTPPAIDLVDRRDDSLVPGVGRPGAPESPRTPGAVRRSPAKAGRLDAEATPRPRPGAPVGSRLRGMLIASGFLLAVVVALLPTVIRNYRLFGKFVPVRTGSGASLMEALGPWADGGPGMDRIVYPPFPAGADEWERDHACRGAALAWAHEHPANAFRLGWAKLRRTWSVTINAPGYLFSRYVLIAWMTVAPEFALAVCGLWALRRQRVVRAFLLLVPIYFTLVHVVFVGSVRYRVPALPFIFILAGVGAVGLWRCLTCRTLTSCVGAGFSRAGDTPQA